MATPSSLLPPAKVETLHKSTSKPPATESNLIKQEQPDTVDRPPPHLVNSIAGLRSLSTALSAFLRHYDELNDHFDSIKTSIDSKLPNHLLSTANPNKSIQISLPEISSSVPSQNPNGTATNPEQNLEDSRKAENADVSKNPARSELENYCETMSGRDMKRYVCTHISDVDKLREELPKALKLAKDPAKLVLDSVGRFYVQGRKAYTKGSNETLRRLAAIVSLECFLLMSDDGIEISQEVKEGAAKSAVEWRKRMITEGGLAKASEADARGLLLLISALGIPGDVFTNEDIRDLIKASNVKEISTYLRRSIILIPKMPEIIEWMVKNSMEIEAVDIAYTFGLEDKCQPRTILTTFFNKKKIDRQHGSSTEVKEAIMKELADLKSTKKCLEAHKIDPSKLLPNFKINGKIASLEKEITELESKATEERNQKRKAKETETSKKPKQHEVKRTRLSGHKNLPEEHKAFDLDHGNGKSLYDGRLPNDYINVYARSSVPRGGPGLLENVNNLAVSGGGYGGPGVDQVVNNSQNYSWHGDTALAERYLSQTYSRPYQPYEPQHPTSGLLGLYGRAPGSGLGSGFAGVLNGGSPVGVGSRGSGSASGLYGFADSVVERETYGPSGGSRAPETYLSSHRPSHLY